MENTDHTTPILTTVNRNTVDAFTDKSVEEIPEWIKSFNALGGKTLKELNSVIQVCTKGHYGQCPHKTL